MNPFLVEYFGTLADIYRYYIHNACGQTSGRYLKNGHIHVCTWWDRHRQHPRSQHWDASKHASECPPARIHGVARRCGLVWFSSSN